MARRRRLEPAQPGTFGREAAEGPLPTRLTPVPPIATIAAEAAALAALDEISETMRAARADERLILALPLAAVDESHLARDRLPPSAEDLAPLRESLRVHGQRLPIEVAVLPGRADRYGLISGWRRLAALRALEAETGDRRFATVRAIVRQAGEASDAYVAMVEENELRSGLSYFERARIVAVTAELGVFASEADALRTLFASASRPRRSKIGSFLAIHAALGSVLRWPERIPERLGLRIAAQIRLDAGESVRARLEAAGAETPAAEIAAIEAALRQPRDRHATEVDEALAPGIRLAIRQGGAGRTVTLSGRGLDAATCTRIRAVLAQALAGRPEAGAAPDPEGD